MTSLVRAEAVVHGDGTRHCAQCGAEIDPIDWCPDCQRDQKPCGTHTRLRKRTDAAFCGSDCRARHRYTYFHPPTARRRF